MAAAERAMERLLASLASCVGAPLRPPPHELVDVAAAAPLLRRFKLDVSFALTSDGRAGARFSLNDKGEEDAFRERLTSRSAALGIDPGSLERFFALSPPGAVQTTLGLKWAEGGGAPHRISLYYEELTRSPRGPELMAAVTSAFGSSRAPAPALTPAAICVDFHAGQPLAIKDYWMAVERDERASVRLPRQLEAFRRAFPLDPERGTRRYLLARRFGPGGEPLGQKLLWQSEAHSAAAAERAWHIVDGLQRSLHMTVGPVAASLETLRQSWTDGSLYLYPDLVCLDVDGDGEPSGLLIYVSIK